MLGLVTSPLNAQGGIAQGAVSATPSADVRAAEVITADEITRQLRVLTGDSLRGRDTPSPSLDRMATYLVGEFQRVASVARLASADRDTASAGRDTAWIQRYPIPGHGYLDWSGTRIFFITTFARRGKAVVSEKGDTLYANAAITFATAARPAIDLVDLNWHKRSGSFPQPPAVRLVAGEHTPESVRHADLKECHVIYVPPAGLDSARERQIVDALLGASRGVLVIADEDSLTFARRLAAARQRPFRMVDHYMSGRIGVSSWGAYAWLPAVQDILMAADVDVVALRQAVTPVVAKLPDFVVDLSAEPDTTRAPAPTAVNVIAVLEGRDPKLKEEYVAFTAHLDTDRDGRGDNAVGLAGLLALAKAFSSPATRPKRSVVFVATSGATKDWWGARYLTARFGGASDGIARRIVTSIHLDALDQIRGDSLAVDGLRDFANASSLAWVGPAHPELGVTITDGGSVGRSAANLGAYLVRFRPSLAFHAVQGSTPADRPSSSASGAAISRVLRLIFYMGYSLADAEAQIGLSAEGRGRLEQAVDGE